MPLTERELRVIKDLEDRLTASSPDLARTLAGPTPIFRLATARLRRPSSLNRKQRVAAILVLLTLGLAVATVAAALGARFASATALLVIEAVAAFAAIHFSGSFQRFRDRRSS